MSESTILVVDDDPEILTFYQKLFAGSNRREFDILGSAGPSHEADLGCLTFSDPEKLLNYYRGAAASGARHPLCIVDMRMPTMNGLAVALVLREIDPEINIVISTAFSDVPIEEIRSKLREGVFFVRKPFVAGEFSLLIHSLVGHWNVRQELTRTQADLAAQFDKIGQVLEATRVRPQPMEETVPPG
jgi:DNA-binding NtrC family response regulator